MTPTGQEPGAEINRRCKQEHRTKVTFFLLFLPVLEVRIGPFILFTIGMFGYDQVNVEPPDWFVIAKFAARTVYHLLPIVDGLAIQRHSDVRKRR